jgi:hypothetical protein
VGGKLPPRRKERKERREREREGGREREMVGERGVYTCIHVYFWCYVTSD